MWQEIPIDMRQWSDVEHLASGGIKFYGFLSGDIDILHRMLRPYFLGKFGSVSQYCFDPSILSAQGAGQCFKLGSIASVWTGMGFVNQKIAMRADRSVIGAKVSNNGHWLDRPGIVNVQYKGKAAEKIKLIPSAIIPPVDWNNKWTVSTLLLIAPAKLWYMRGSEARPQYHPFPKVAWLRQQPLREKK
jgi:hypothetical protein